MTRLTMLATAAAAALSIAGTADAAKPSLQQDQRAIAILNVLNTTFTNDCYAGNSYACAGKSYVRDIGGYMWAASEACDNGNNTACNQYEQAYRELENAYTRISYHFDLVGFGECGLSWSAAKSRIRGWSTGWNGNAYDAWDHNQFISYIS